MGFDDKETADWEIEFGGPDDDTIENGYELTAKGNQAIHKVNEGYAKSNTPYETPLNSAPVLKLATQVALNYALRQGQLDLFRTMLDTGLSPETFYFGSRTPLMFALYKKNLELTKLCLDYGASPFAFDDDMYLVIREALKEDNECSRLVIEAALKRGIEADATYIKDDYLEPCANTFDFYVEAGVRYQLLWTNDSGTELHDETQLLFSFPRLAVMVEMGLEDLFLRALHVGYDVFGLRNPEPDRDDEFNVCYGEMEQGSANYDRKVYERYPFVLGADPLMQVIFHFRQYRMGWMLNEFRMKRLESESDTYVSAMQEQERKNLFVSIEQNAMKLDEAIKLTGQTFPSNEEIFGKKADPLSAAMIKAINPFELDDLDAIPF